jgi:hypothetical protein
MSLVWSLCDSSWQLCWVSCLECADFTHLQRWDQVWGLCCGSRLESEYLSGTELTVSSRVLCTDAGELLTGITESKFWVGRGVAKIWGADLLLRCASLSTEIKPQEQVMKRTMIFWDFPSCLLYLCPYLSLSIVCVYDSASLCLLSLLCLFLYVVFLCICLCLCVSLLCTYLLCFFMSILFLSVCVGLLVSLLFCSGRAWVMHTKITMCIRAVQRNRLHTCSHTCMCVCLYMHMCVYKHTYAQIVSYNTNLT